MLEQKTISNNSLESSAAGVPKSLLTTFDRSNYLSEVVQFGMALLGLGLALPLFIIIGAAIKLTSSGPIFYRGLRVGKHQQVFKIFKFRTLQVGAEEKIGARLLTEYDAYYTVIGRFLKRTKLDELPQLLNVIKGEMNLVGPRPVRPIFLDGLCHAIPLYPLRLMVKPGMTGLAQIKGGYFTEPKDKLRYELVYLKNRSFWLDMKLIFLTLFMLLNRWFTLGFLCLTLFLFVSFVSESLLKSTSTQISSTKLNFIHLAIVLGAAWILMKRVYKNTLVLYKTPINFPMALFFLIATLTSYLAIQPVTAFRGAVYYGVTGFLIVLLIMNGQTTRGFITSTARVLSILTVIVSIVGLFELFITHHTIITYLENESGQVMLEWPRISSTLGNPVTLSTYLVLGFPLLLCELANAEKKHSRDFWLVSTTIAFLAIILTQTRLALLSLAVSGAIFYVKRSKYYSIAFIVGFALLLSIIPLIGISRYSPSQAVDEFKRAIASAATPFSHNSVERILTGIGTRNLGNIPSPKSAVSDDQATEQVRLPPNMHLTLLIENGLIGWLLMMWILGAALRFLYVAFPKVDDPHLRLVLWAIFASICGFLVSMNGSDVFYKLSIQIIFWSLLGMGVAIGTHFTGKRAGFIRLWRFGADHR